MTNNFYRVHEFCELYGLGRSTFYNEVAQGLLHPFKYGRRTLIPAWEAERWHLDRCQPHKIGTGSLKSRWRLREAFSISAWFKLFFQKLR